MSEVMILGSGSGFATTERFCTSIALMVENSLYMLDCGEPAAALLFRAGIDPLALKTLFITHMHPDHVGGLASLLAAIYLPARAGNRKFKPWSVNRNDPWYRDNMWFPPDRTEINVETRQAIRIVMPGEAIEPIKTYLAAVYLSPSILPFDLEFEAIQTGQTYEDDLIRVTTTPNAHLTSNFRYKDLPVTHPGMTLESYSLRIDVGDTNFVFSADIDHLGELEPLLDGVDTLIVETAHYEPSEIRPFADKHNLNRIFLTHVHPGLEETVAGLVRQWDDPRIQIAHDGLRIALGAEEGVL